MNTITMTAATVELAIENGLKQLNASREDVIIVVLQENKKGFLGFGQKEAIVSLTVKPKAFEQNETIVEKSVKSVEKDVKLTEKVVEDKTVSTTTQKTVEATPQPTHHHKVDANEKYKEVVTYLVNISKEYGADITVDVKETSKKLIFQIETAKAGLLIGKYGKIINALQVLTQTMVYREDEKAPMVIVNIGDYRQKREEKLKEMADRTAKKVLRTRQAVYLEPLPAFERKIVHARISRYDQLVTQSEGKEPHRYLKVEFNQKPF
ncbi:protein jag [Carnobacteriaceae bacterium zg-ZUI240]|nr:protein jag [Carnobacteriaceae bacterium zg-ZUI240]